MTDYCLAKTLKRLGVAVLVSMAFALFAALPTVAQEREWQPQRTWVFIVGTLQWEHSEMFESFPQKNRRDAQLASFFKTQGVPAEHMVYLKDRQATTRQVRTAFRDLLSQAREGDMLFVYYTGHGYKSDDERTTFFATYDAGDDVPGWATSSLVGDIERYFKGSEAFLAADCCYSGSLAQQVRKLNSRISYACLASSSANELSTANWTFTEMLLAGLKGKAYADINHDGEITLQELAEDIRADMAFAEEQQSAFVATGVFTNQTVLARAEKRSSSEVSKRVEVKSEGDWYKARIIDTGQGQYKVHYYGYDDWYDEWVSARQVRDGKVARTATGSAVGSSSRNGRWPGDPR
jgi:Caspase domain